MAQFPTYWFIRPRYIHLPFGIGKPSILTLRIHKSLQQTWNMPCNYIGVSKNRATPKSFILIGFSIIKPSILGHPYFWKHPIHCNSCPFIPPFIAVAMPCRFVSVPFESWPRPTTPRSPRLRIPTARSVRPTQFLPWKKVRWKHLKLERKNKTVDAHKSYQTMRYDIVS